MAAISHVFTIRRAAQILGRDEDLLWELSDQLEPEDGKLWVRDIDGAETPRLHPRWHRGSSRNYQGSDRSRRLISRRVYRGAQRMLTARSDFGCDLVEVKLHSFGVAGRQHEGSAGSAFGADRTEQVGRLGPLIVGGTGA